MDDFFGPKEENHAAEDAYEWGWIEATRLERNRIRTIALEAAGLGAASIMEKAPDVEMPVDELIENVLKLIDEV